MQQVACKIQDAACSLPGKFSNPRPGTGSFRPEKIHAEMTFGGVNLDLHRNRKLVVSNK